MLLALACVGVLLAGLRRAPKPQAETGAERAFFRSQLEGIDRDVEGGRMSATEAEAARAELAREVIRHEKETGHGRAGANGRIVLMAVLPVLVVGSLGLYAVIGRADLPAQPLSTREIATLPGQMSVDEAVARVEAQMAETPGDVRGWLVLAPIYMTQERYGEAANAWRRVLELEPPTSTRQTNLAEAMIMANGGESTPESMALLREAVAGDPLGVRQRFYLAGQLTDSGEFAEAIPIWEELLALAEGSEPWIETAGNGLAAAQAGLASTALDASSPDATLDVMIRGMVDGLAARLAGEGGSADEWMQLVRSRQQLDGDAAAREDLARGLDALEGDDRLALEDLARELEL
ncbi:c-type cytochrome biogenesis protein CcmI [Pelagibacterium lacus]|uniref:C-type cytochrome biogenesis protein CcmI n=1 Tax=Pelagibacterium lacus TaxID=2282655 RepID=A0A369W7U2_9HYPH|nr:c-type cytochrome biogenesis protein CcmI [Pelagibacterium lacus]